MSRNTTNSYDLDAHSFVVEQLYGDRAGNPYTPESDRAIFWAMKEAK